MRQGVPVLAVEDYIKQGSPGNDVVLQETMPRSRVSADNAIGATGVVHATGVALDAGDVVGAVTFVTGGTAAGTPTAGFVALYSADATPVLLAQSANFTTTARAANTAYKVALQSQVLITKPGLYYVAVSFTATTVPTLRGASLGNAVVSGAVVAGMPVLAQTFGSGVGGTAPASITGGTAVATPCYLVLTTS